ncbi:MAG TPA: hypothetical protein VMM36_14520 [Opitutaceae bacterium]|nr:hypothetical protein [Opitutaceae bacterium]
MPAVGAAVAGARLPLAFIAFGIGCLAHVLACLALEPALLLQPHISPRVLALVHAWVPGFLVSVCLGACYQMMPVVLGVPLARSPWRLWAHLALHALGVTILISGFTRGRYEWVAVGGVVASLGIVSFAHVAWRTFAGSTRRDAIAWSFPISATWLLATVTLGVVIAVDRRWGAFGLPTMRLLPVHAHFGLVGFFLTLLQGIAFQLVPMFTMGELRRPRLVAAALVATQIGLVCLASGLATGIQALALVGGVVLAGGIVSSGVAFVATLRSRRRRKLEPTLHAFVVGASMLPVAAILGLVLLSTRVVDKTPSVPTVYGIVIIAGALSFMIMGMLGKIVPFLVWMKAYGPLIGRQSVPVATTLSSKGCECVWMIAQAAGVVLALAAVGSGSHALAWTAAWVLTLGGAIYMWNLGRVARHLWRRGPFVPAALTFQT